MPSGTAIRIPPQSLFTRFPVALATTFIIDAKKAFDLSISFDDQVSAFL